MQKDSVYKRLEHELRALWPQLTDENASEDVKSRFPLEIKIGHPRSCRAFNLAALAQPVDAHTHIEMHHLCHVCRGLPATQVRKGWNGQRSWMRAIE